MSFNPETELATLEGRHTALVADVEQSKSALEAARAGLVDGTATAQDVIVAQGHFTALSEAVPPLATRIEAARAQVADQAKEAAHEGEKQRLQGIARAALESDATARVLAREAAQALAESVVALSTETARGLTLKAELASAANSAGAPLFGATDDATRKQLAYTPSSRSSDGLATFGALNLFPDIKPDDAFAVGAIGVLGALNAQAAQETATRQAEKREARNRRAWSPITAQKEPVQ